MSVPIFEKGVIYTLEQIKEIINTTPVDELDYYLNTNFKFLGVNK